MKLWYSLDLKSKTKLINDIDITIKFIFNIVFNKNFNTIIINEYG